MNDRRGLRTVYIALAIQIFCILRTHSQEVTLLPDDYVYKLWNNRTGLPQNTVFDIARDEQGYLWIATAEGLVRFDSHDFKLTNQENTPGLFSNTFYSLSQSITGGIWAASRNGLLLINKNTTNAIDLRSYIQGAWITAIAEDSTGRLWIATNTGHLLYVHEGSVHACRAWGSRSVSIQVLQPVADGIFVGTNEGLFELRNHGEEIAFIDELQGTDVRALANDRDGSLWIGTKENGLFQKTVTGIKHYSVKDGLSESFVYTLTAAPNGELWIGTSTSGIQVYSNGLFTRLQKREYSQDAIRCIFMDEDNSVWLGTTSYGLVQMKPANVKMISQSSGLSGHIILAIYEHSNGDIWIGTAGNGLNRISGGKVTHFTRRDGLQHDIVLSVYGTNEYIFIGTGNGLDRFNLRTGKIDAHYTTKDGLTSNIIQCVFFDSSATLWITTRKGGIHRMTKDEKVERVKLPAEFANAEFSSIFEDGKNNMWFGSNGAGILRISNKNEITAYPANKDIPAERIFDFYEDRQGALWICTKAGLMCFMDGEFRLFDKANGLNFNGIYRMIDDGLGFLWLSGNFGIQRLAQADLEKLKRKSNGMNVRVPVRLFDTNDGMANSETNGGVFPAGWKMKDGSLWFPTMEGIATIEPALIDNNKAGVNIYIQSMIYGEKENNPETKIEVPAGVYSIEIPYTSIDFKNPNTINYFFRLNGLFEEWKPAGERRTAYLTGLSPGEYTFEVKAEQFGDWSETARLSFEVKPFFYQTTWFIACIVFVLLAAGFFVKELHSKHRQAAKLRSVVDERNRQLLESGEMNKELDSFSYSVSHDLQAPLRWIHGYATILMEDYEEKLDEAGKKALRSIMSNAVRMRELIEDLLSFSHTGGQTIKRQLVDMNTLTKEVIAELKDQQQNKKAEVLQNPLISIEGDESMLRQVMINLLSNAFKYSAKKAKPLIAMGSQKENGNVVYYIKDNGVGFDMQYYNKMFSAFRRLHSAEDFEGTGVGLALVHRIITKHGGKVWAQGKVDEGATFYFSLPLTKSAAKAG